MEGDKEWETCQPQLISLTLFNQLHCEYSIYSNGMKIMEKSNMFVPAACICFFHVLFINIYEYALCMVCEKYDKCMECMTCWDIVISLCWSCLYQPVYELWLHFRQIFTFQEVCMNDLSALSIASSLVGKKDQMFILDKQFSEIYLSV